MCGASCSRTGFLEYSQQLKALVLIGTLYRSYKYAQLLYVQKRDPFDVLVDFGRLRSAVSRIGAGGEDGSSSN